MEKTISITLNGQVFNIEEEAYAKLKEYLDSIREHLRSSDDKTEIISDIEASIAEKFGQKISDAKQVITQKDVADLIAVMGTVEDLANELAGPSMDEGGEEKAAPAEDKHRFGKKLYRNPDDVVISGVCSGLGAYFGIDPVIIRLLFVVSFFAYGTSAFIYIILWIAMPLARTRAQKLEMHGDPVTLASIEESVKGKLPAEPETRAAWQRILYFPFEVIGAVVNATKNLLKAASPVLRWIIGLVLAGSGVFFMVVSMFVGGVMLFNIDSSFIRSDIPLEPIVTQGMYQLAVVSAVLVALIPLLFVAMLGLSLIRRRNVVSLPVGVSLFGVWMLAAVTAGVAALDVAPSVKEAVDESNRNTAVKELDFEGFDSLYVSGKHQVYVRQGDEYSVTLEGRQVDLDRTGVSLDQNGSRLRINREDWSSWCIFCYDEGLKVDIVTPELEKVYGTYLSRTYVRDFQQDKMEIRLRSNARAELAASTTELEARLEDSSRLFWEGETEDLVGRVTDVADFYSDRSIAGSMVLQLDDSADVDLAGQVDRLECRLNGMADLDARDMRIGYANLILDDMGKAMLGQTDRILVTGRGSSKVYYEGEPDLETHLHDLATVRQKTGSNP